MPATKSLRELVHSEVARDPAFAEALMRESDARKHRRAAGR